MRIIAPIIPILNIAVATFAASRAEGKASLHPMLSYRMPKVIKIPTPPIVINSRTRIVNIFIAITI